MQVISKNTFKTNEERLSSLSDEEMFIELQNIVTRAKDRGLAYGRQTATDIGRECVKRGIISKDNPHFKTVELEYKKERKGRE
jgi:hypothetical protein